MSAISRSNSARSSGTVIARRISFSVLWNRSTTAMLPHFPTAPNRGRIFLASHQTGVAQLAIKYCSVMVDNATTRAAFFPGLNVGAAPATQFAGNGRDILVVPLLQKAVGVNVGSQPTDTEVRTELNALIDRLAGKPGASSATVAKAACAAALGSGVLSIL